MSRPMKFRAWIPSYTSMDYSHKEDFGDVHRWAYDETGKPVVLSQHTEPAYDKHFDSWHKETSFVPLEQHIMQFTGLLDKNGKEIYEGGMF